MKIVVDTNIVFSALLNSGSRISKILIGSKNYFDFYSCEFLKEEIGLHHSRIQKRTGVSFMELSELQYIITKNITFINEKLIPHSTLMKSESMLQGIDVKDTPFVALTTHLKAKLWTGDKELIAGLTKKNFNQTITTTELGILFDKWKERKGIKGSLRVKLQEKMGS